MTTENIKTGFVEKEIHSFRYNIGTDGFFEMKFADNGSIYIANEDSSPEGIIDLYNVVSDLDAFNNPILLSITEVVDEEEDMSKTPSGRDIEGAEVQWTTYVFETSEGNITVKFFGEGNGYTMVNPILSESIGYVSVSK